jgi:hypothetical protein
MYESSMTPFGPGIMRIIAKMNARVWAMTATIGVLGSEKPIMNVRLSGSLVGFWSTIQMQNEEVT